MKRIILRQYSYGFRVVETVGTWIDDANKPCTLTIQWDGLFESESSAKSHAEKVLKCQLTKVCNGVFEPK